MPRLAQLTSASMPSLEGMNALEFHCIQGHEAIGECFEYRLTTITPDVPYLSEALISNVPYKDLLGKELTVDMETDGGRRQITGLVTRARFVEAQDRRGVYEFILEPSLVLAQRSSDFKIFQNKTALQIVREVLKDFPLSVDNRTSNTYTSLDFVVQYGETHYAFIKRLMAEWGMYFFFEHSGGFHRMVLVDEPGAHKPCVGKYASLNVYPPSHKVDEEYVSSFGAVHSLQSGQWVTQEYDFRVPKKDWKTVNAKPRSTGNAHMERFSWPSDIVNPNPQSSPSGDQEAMAKHLTRMRMEEAGTGGERAQGAGMLRGIAVGNTFDLAKHPNQKSNTTYLVLSQSFFLRDNANSSTGGGGGGGGGGTYECHSHFTVQPAKDNFRMASEVDDSGRALKPRTHGPQTAVVTGPPGREIWTDEYGRVKVSFHWNRYCSKDQNSSCWVRVATPHAGSNFGAISIPRIGQEVIVDFENGDPDRPIVIGAVYNALHMPPWALPANQTQSGILTRSTEEGGVANANALRFEDKKGKEELWLHAEKDQRIEVENDESHWVGHDRTKTIDHDETNHIKNDRTETVDGHETITVHKTRTETVDLDETLTVHKNQSLSVDLNRSKTVGVNETVNIGANWSVSTGANKTETIGSGYTQTTSLYKMVNIGAAYNLNVGAAMMTNVGLARVDSVGLSWNMNVGMDFVLTAGKSITLKTGDSVLVMKSDGTITINGKTVDVVGSSHVGVESKLIDMN